MMTELASKDKWDGREESDRALVAQDTSVRSHRVGNANLVRTDSTIRSLFLNRLGIAQVHSSTRNRRNPESSCRRDPVVLKEPLKLHPHQSDRYIKTQNQSTPALASSYSSSSSISSTTSSRKSRSVSFDDSVTVVPIPMRDEYSDRIKHQLWTDSKEFFVNANRNAVEFSSENWDWRQVAEDDDMVVSVTGERIHPVHYMLQQPYNSTQRFLMAMAAQQRQRRQQTSPVVH